MSSFDIRVLRLSLSQALLAGLKVLLFPMHDLWILKLSKMRHVEYWKLVVFR